jgi:hypothetical protein
VSTSGMDWAFLHVASQWNEFYTRARALRNEGIDKVEPYRFPKDNDPTLDEACEALSEALEDASKAMVDNDTTEIEQALDKLRKVYDDAAKSNTVEVRYIDAEPPSEPFSPLDGDIQRTILARPWMMELIRGLLDKSLPNRLVVIGNPGSGEFLRLILPLMPSLVCTTKHNPGKSVSLVGYLLFYLIARGQRVVLQSDTPNGGLGYVFDDRGVHEVFRPTALIYNDGEPCYLLVSGDGAEIYPQKIFAFCDRIIVVTSPNMMIKPHLKFWTKQKSAEQFIAPPPSCLEVVYLLYVELFR